MNKSRPFQEGLFQVANGALQLIGSQCKSCGRIVYPSAKTCLDCGYDDVAQVPLSSEGTLYSFTTVHMPASHFDPPFDVGYVKLPEGLCIFAPVAQGATLEVGTPVRLVHSVLWREDDCDVMGYRIATE